MFGMHKREQDAIGQTIAPKVLFMMRSLLRKTPINALLVTLSLFALFALSAPLALSSDGGNPSLSDANRNAVDSLLEQIDALMRLPEDDRERLLDVLESRIEGTGEEMRAIEARLREMRERIEQFQALKNYLGGLESQVTAPDSEDAALRIAHGAPDGFLNDVLPVLRKNCFSCHGNGADSGGLSLDRYASYAEMTGDRNTWLSVLKNLRAGIMPPKELPRPAADSVNAIESWIKNAVFEIDPDNPDPGRVTIRRLNREEYRNTIRDLMGIDFKTEEEFPPDDTGFGFDNIGDVLSVSPLLLEKYLDAAETIVNRAVPLESKVMPVDYIDGDEFRGENRGVRGERLSFYEENSVRHTAKIRHNGDYRVVVDIEVDGSFDFDPGRCEVTFTIDGEERFSEEFAWHASERIQYEFEEIWEEGERELAFHVKPLVSEDERRNRLDFRVRSVRVEGPMDRELWRTPEDYPRFFPREEPPEDREERREYAYEVIEAFAFKAFRRPPGGETVDRLVSLAESIYTEPGKSFEEGVARAMTAVLASPRFLFRLEEPIPSADGGHPPIDEYSLASRLSYFFWSSMPDGELFELAKAGRLREEFDEQVSRMLEDSRSDKFVENFTGQWLQARDVEVVPINAWRVLGRPRRSRDGNYFEFDRELRRAMRRETEMAFEHVMRGDRPLTELLDAGYTFVNERLAEVYGIEGVEGDEMRRVELPGNSPRGGVLTQGTVLTVTSNPTRTSPVKRGVYILDNILGLPAPPAPPNVPELEEAKEGLKDLGREPTLREMMELHRQQPLCNSCHARFDPLGMALENFNALGMWRDEENDQPIDASGELITGEKFQDIRDLKRILGGEYRKEFYRCVTEKMLIYAIGRGLEYYDTHTVDAIVSQLEREDGRFSVLVEGIVHSAPFQRKRAEDIETSRPIGTAEIH